jgi:hypothetical protein
VRSWFLYANWNAEVRNQSEAVIALRENVTSPTQPSTSSIFGCCRSKTLGPFPMMCCSLVTQYLEHRADVHRSHVENGKRTYTSLSCPAPNQARLVAS